MVHFAQRLRRGVLAVVLAAVALLMSQGLFDSATAAFRASVSNVNNSLSAAAQFPTYEQAIGTDGPSHYYRMEEPISSAATSAATDSSGASRTGTYHGVTNGPTQWWRFDEDSGTATYDRAGGGFKGTLGSGATWATGAGAGTGGASGGGVTLDGTANSYVAGTTSPVRTDASFSVAAWARTTNVGAVVRVVASQGTGANSGFFLKYQNGGWEFTLPGDPLGGSSSWVSAAVTAPDGNTLNTWVHLVGVYDDANDMIQLYVNGALAASASRPDAYEWHASGGLNVGRGRFSSAWTDPFVGGVDDVRVYNRALAQADIDKIVVAAGDPASADWRFDDGTYNLLTTDASGNANTLALTGVPAAPNSRVAGANGTTYAVPLSGTSYGQAPKAVVRTDQSFTVAAWLRNTDGVLSNWHGAISQPGSNNNGFIVEYRGDNNKFAFSMALSDVDTPAWTDVFSTTSPVTGTWYHVVGVYDAAAGAARIYVNGTQEASATRPTPTWSATGMTQVGRRMYNAVYGNQWVGAMDGIVLYQRALTGAAVSMLTSTTAPSGSFAAAQRGALQGSLGAASTAVAFTGAANAAYATQVASTTTNLSLECWFRTDSVAGGALISFASPATGQGQQLNKTLYLNSTGKIVAGVFNGTSRSVATSPLSYNDGGWHHLVVSISSTSGTQIYADGVAVATNAAMTASDGVSGYWRWGGASLGSWPTRPSSDYFIGMLDEVAVYPSVLSQDQVTIHYYAGLR